MVGGWGGGGRERVILEHSMGKRERVILDHSMEERESYTRA